MLTNEENAFANIFLTIDPKRFGFKGEWYGLNESHKNMIRVKKFADTRDGCHYLPSDVVAAFDKMNKAMMREVGKVLYLDSGFRSGAYQLIIFFQQLSANKFNLKKTCRRVALPGWSEHGAPERQACDFITLDILRGKKDNFSCTPEYKWLLEHANAFGFYLSYPKNNKFGVVFEPWHWHWEKP